MGEYSVLPIEVHRTGFKIGLHYSKAFLNLPSAFVCFDYAAYTVIKVCANSIEAIIFFFLCYHSFIYVTYGLFSNLAVFCGMICLDETFGIILLFSSP